MPGNPKTLDELFRFYHDYVKLLYSSVQADGHLTVETLFELNAALDHVSRHWAYNESEEAVVDRAYGHLKRSCLDIFKLKLKDTSRQFQELRKIDTSIIDNGEFDGRLIALYHKIKMCAIEARRLEGKPANQGESGATAFELWQPVYDDCVTFEKEFYYHPKIHWAKMRMAFYKRKEFWLGVISGVISIGIFEIFRWLWNLARNLPNK